LAHRNGNGLIAGFLWTQETAHLLFVFPGLRPCAGWEDSWSRIFRVYTFVFNTNGFTEVCLAALIAFDAKVENENLATNCPGDVSGLLTVCNNCHSLLVWTVLASRFDDS